MKIFDYKEKKVLLLIPAVIVIILVIAIIVFRNQIGQNRVGQGELEKRQYEKVSNEAELGDKLDIDINGIEGGNAKSYIEDENIGRIDYELNNMNLTLKVTKDLEKDLVNMYHEWNNDILMTSTCTDGTKINVIANVAFDEPTVMRARWRDNDLFYSMTTQNLTTREEFLQEINRLVIQNHK